MLAQRKSFQRIDIRVEYDLGNGNMSFSQSGEGDICHALSGGGLVDCTVALQGQHFYSAQIPVYHWFDGKEVSPLGWKSIQMQIPTPEHLAKFSLFA